jgi:uncharacterized phosphosugar-binding protein
MADEDDATVALDIRALSAAALQLLRPAVAAAAEEWAAIGSVAARLADVIMAGGGVYAFGAGHATAFAAELYSRAGGIAAFTAMSLEDLRDTLRAARLQYSDSEPERVPGNGSALLDLYGVTARDALLIASQSGRNGAGIEMALEARRRGIYTVGVLSVQHCMAQPSRHPSGLRLIAAVDTVIDNHCPVGDAVLKIVEGERVCGTSTVAFALIAQLLNAEVIRNLVAAGRPPAVIRSANVDGR